MAVDMAVDMALDMAVDDVCVQDDLQQYKH